MNWIADKISHLKEKKLYRILRPARRLTSARVVFDGAELINFSTNDYLGLSGRRSVIEKAKLAMDVYGAGSRSSRLISGTTLEHDLLEAELAGFLGREKSLVFSSGYAANIGLINSLAQKGDALIIDRLNHASIIDACKMCEARLFVYPHNDTDILEKILKRAAPYKKRYIVSDTVFSMDGDMAKLSEISALADKYRATVLVDEAHACGIFGVNGRGACEYLGVEHKIELIIGTISKTFGAQGGFAAGPTELKDLLVNTARPFIYSTSLSAALCAAARESLCIIKREPELRKKLLDNSAYLRAKLNALGFNTLNSCSQVIPVLTGDLGTTECFSKKLFGKGVYAPPIRPPTVPDGMCRLRLSLSAEHSLEDIDYLIGAFKSL